MHEFSIIASSDKRLKWPEKKPLLNNVCWTFPYNYQREEYVMRPWPVYKLCIWVFFRCQDKTSCYVLIPPNLHNLPVSPLL